MPSVFISYAREDQAFVRFLHGELEQRGYDVWVDWQGIPPSADYLHEIERAIDGADAVLVVISPELAASRVCAQELQHAIDAQKRLIPLLRRGTRSATVPDAVRRLNWIPFDESADQAAALAATVAAIETDLGWVTTHTRLLLRAGEWEARGRDPNLLLRGRPLREAEEWLAGVDPGRDPQPAAVQRQFLLASRRAATGRARRLIAVASLATLVSLTLAVVAFLQREEAIDQRANAVAQQREAETQRAEAERQRGEAETQRTEAERQRGEAETQAALARSRALAANAIALLPTDPELSVRLAVEAIGVARTDEAETALRRALGASHVRAVLPGGAARVLDVAFSSDGSRLYAADGDGSVRAWDTATHAQLWQTAPAPAPVVAIALSPDGTAIAGTAADGGVRLWGASDGAVRAEAAGHEGVAWAVAWSPDGSRVATAGDDGAVRVWDGATGASLVTLPGDAGGLLHLAWSPDGGTLAAGSADGTALLWAMPAGGAPRELVPATRQPESFQGAWGINHVRFSPDGATLLTASYDGSARLWDVATGELRAELLNRPILNQLRPFVSDALFSPDGSLIATASSDGVVRLWDAKTGAREADLRGLLDAVTQIAFSPDGRRLAAASFDGTARVWDVETGFPTAQLAGHTGFVLAVAFDPSGDRVATGGVDATVRLWEADTGAIATALGDPLQQGLTAAFTGNGRVLIAEVSGKSASYDAVTGVPAGDPVTWNVGRFASWSGGAVAPGGGRVLAGDLATGHAAIWDTATGRLVAELTGHTEWIRGVAWSPDARIVATASADGTARLWDATSGTPLRTLRIGAIVEAVAFSPDGSGLATGSDDGVVRVWDVATGEVRFELPVPSSAIVYSLAFDRAGTRLAAGGGDNAVHLFDLAERRDALILRGHTIQVTAVAFSPDGAQVVSGDWGGEVRVWDSTAGETLAVLHGHRDTIKAVAIGEAVPGGGEAILTLGASGPARLTPCDVCGDVDHLLAVAAARGTRELTPDERARYLGEGSAAASPIASPAPVAATPAATPEPVPSAPRATPEERAVETIATPATPGEESPG